MTPNTLRGCERASRDRHDPCADLFCDGGRQRGVLPAERRDDHALSGHVYVSVCCLMAGYRGEAATAESHHHRRRQASHTEAHHDRA